MNNNLLLGTSNAGKIEEFLFYISFYNLFKKNNIKTLKDFPGTYEPEESSLKFSGNALIKAESFYNQTKLKTLSDDSGFVVDYKNKFPGVKTARLASEKGGVSGAVLSIFSKYKNRAEIPATFFCSLCLFDYNNKFEVTGKINGKLIKEPKGKSGFGYDSFFVPKNSNKTYGEMEKEEKLLNSHRYEAFKKIAKYII